MKLAVSSTGPDMSAAVDGRFGRCPYFVVVDTDTDEHVAMANSAAESAQGAGIAAASDVAKAGAGVVLTGHVGPNAIRALSELGIKVHQAPVGTVANAVAQFSRGECTEVTAPTVPSYSGMNTGAGGGAGRGMGRGGGRGRGGR